jgi:serine/threonine-protein kinase
VKLMDFGIAKSVGDVSLTHTGALLGTPAYMSPEQVLGCVADGRGDLFSLGVVLHEMLTGRRPFEGSSVPELLHAVAYDQPRIASALRPAIQAVIRKALAKDPGSRFASALEMARALEAATRAPGTGAARAYTPSWTAGPAPAAAPGPVLATTVSGTTRPGPRRGSPLATFGIALVVLSLVGLVVGPLVGGGPSGSGPRPNPTPLAKPSAAPPMPQKGGQGPDHQTAHLTGAPSRAAPAPAISRSDPFGYAQPPVAPLGPTQRKCPTCGGAGRAGPCKECEGTGRCERCGGTGRSSDACFFCGGTGWETCLHCGGTGVRAAYGVRCSFCGGTGRVRCQMCGGVGRTMCMSCSGTGKCTSCSGTGRAWCPTCWGTGWVSD